MKTTAAVLREIGAPLSIEELEIPQLQPGQVLVQLTYSGVCHTQLSEVRGRKGPDRFLPHTLGHEGSGMILAVSDTVQHVKSGEHVILSWLKSQGADVPSSRYHSHQGLVNSGAVSTFQHYAVVSENRVIPVSADFPLREAALLGCAIPTGAGIIRNTLNVQTGDSVAIFGAGGVGLSALIAAKALGAEPIFVVDLIPERLEKARTLGADVIIHATFNDPVDIIRTATQGQGVLHAVESAGKSMAMEAAFASIRPGGTAVLAGNLGAGERINIDPFDLIRGKRILGSWGGETILNRDIPIYIKGIQNGSMPFKNLIDREYSLEQIDEALHNLEKNTTGRALLRLTEHV